MSGFTPALATQMFDGFEEHGRPWEMCSSGCSAPVDHFACSIISASRPRVFPNGAPEGLVLSADTQLLCAFSHDGMPHKAYQLGTKSSRLSSNGGWGWEGCGVVSRLMECGRGAVAKLFCPGPLTRRMDGV